MDAAIPEAPSPNFRRKLALLLAATAALYLCQLGSSAVVSEEFRWAEIAREMRASGHYLRPTINGQPYYDKPVGSYWLIVAASHLTGGVNETAARLPAAVCGILGVWLLVLMGRRLYCEEVGLLGGAILATCFGYTFYARRATADIETLTGVLAALWLFVRYRERGGPWVIALWLIMAANSLTKGLLGFVLPLGVMAAETFWLAWPERRAPNLDVALRKHGRWFFNLWTLLAMPLAFGLYLAPFLLAAQQSGGSAGLDMVWRENIKRFINPHNHTGPVYLYVGAIFVLALPWCAFLPAALVGKVRTPGERFTRFYFWLIFAFFTLSVSRRNYYMLPVLPPLALLIADLLLKPRAELGTLRRKLRDGGYAVFALGVLLCGLGLLSPVWVLKPPYDALPPLPYRAAFAVGWLAVLGMLAYGFVSPTRQRGIPSSTSPLVGEVDSRSESGGGSGITPHPPRSAATSPTRGEVKTSAFAIAAFALFLYGFGIAWPAFEEQRTRRAFVQEIQARTSEASDGFALFHARDAIFDLGRTAPEYTDANELFTAIHAGHVKWIVARRRYLEGLSLPADVLAEEASQPWEAADQRGNKLVLLKVR